MWTWCCLKLRLPPPGTSARRAFCGRCLSTPFQKFTIVSRDRLLTRAALFRATTGEGVVFWRYETVFAKPCTKLLNFINTVSCLTVAWALRMPR
ncbi:hypothetical protein SBA6_70053 [Candidatus Sulfopaludibacter sp. SbA6]|nr:hypothetical protein SBA6_70053 [Candidatus Sulfopaludibacter sp. SbA6]